MAVQTALGRFQWDDPCWVSEPISVRLFRGAEVRIQIFPERDDDEGFLLADQLEAFQRFLALPESRSAEIIPHLWRYYRDVRASVAPPDVPEISDPSAVWRHVTPRFASPCRDESGVVYVSVEAECDWEIEHGLQLVLQNGERWVRVSDYSGHLTDGRAWGKRFLDDWMADPAKSLPVRSVADLSEAKA